MKNFRHQLPYAGVDIQPNENWIIWRKPHDYFPHQRSRPHIHIVCRANRHHHAKDSGSYCMTRKFLSIIISISLEKSYKVTVFTNWIHNCSVFLCFFFTLALFQFHQITILTKFTATINVTSGNNLRGTTAESVRTTYVNGKSEIGHNRKNVLRFHFGIYFAAQFRRKKYWRNDLEYSQILNKNSMS